MSIFRQLGYTQYKNHEFLCRPLQRIDVVNFSTTPIQVWCMEHVRNLYGACRQTCQVLYQSTYAYFFYFFWDLSKKIHSREISTETQNSYLSNTQSTQNITQPPSMSNTSRRCHCGAGLPGTSVNVAVLPSPSPDRRRRPKKQRRVSRRPPERKPRHCGGRDGSAGAISPYPNEGGACGSGTCRVGPGGRVSTLHSGT